MYGYGPTIVDVQESADAADRDVVRMVSGRPDWDPPEALREGLHEAAEANHLAMAHALERDAGDVALVLDPGYPYYAARVRMLGGRVRRVPVGSDGHLDAARLREAADENVALVVVNTPNNPTGAVYDRETLRRVVGVAEAHDAVLVSDEVYGRIDRSGEFASALSVDSDHRVITGSVSKSLAATGLRVGYAVVPEPLRAATTMRHVLTTIAASRPAQHAVLRALADVDESYHRAVRERLDRRAATFVDALDGVGAEYVDPVGGMYVFARLPGVPGTVPNVHRLIAEAGVAAMPGATFGSAYEEWIRFSLTTPRVGTAADRVAAFVRSV